MVILGIEHKSTLFILFFLIFSFTVHFFQSYRLLQSRRMYWVCLWNLMNSSLSHSHNKTHSEDRSSLITSLPFYSLMELPSDHPLSPAWRSPCSNSGVFFSRLRFLLSTLQLQQMPFCCLLSRTQNLLFHAYRCHLMLWSMRLPPPQKSDI